MTCGPKFLKCPGNPKEIMHFPMDVLRCPTFRVPSLYLNGECHISENRCLTGILSGRGKHRYRFCLLIDISWARKRPNYHIEDMHSGRVFPVTWPSMRYTLLFNLLTLLTPLALLDNVPGAIEHQASGYKDSKVRYIGNRKARE